VRKALLLVLLAAAPAWGSYFEHYFRNLGDMAFLALIHDGGGVPGGPSIHEQRRYFDEVVASEQMGWRAQTARFLRGRHDYGRTAALVVVPYRDRSPNRICVWLPHSSGELCYTSRIPVVESGILALRFATVFRRIADGGNQPPMGSERTLDEAFAAYAEAAPREPPMAASKLALRVREVLASAPDADVVRLTRKAQDALSRLDPKYLDGIVGDVKLFRAEIAAAGLR